MRNYRIWFFVNEIENNPLSLWPGNQTSNIKFLNICGLGSRGCVAWKLWSRPIWYDQRLKYESISFIISLRFGRITTFLNFVTSNVIITKAIFKLFGPDQESKKAYRWWRCEMRGFPAIGRLVAHRRENDDGEHATHWFTVTGVTYQNKS